jgi:phosphatidylglycerophosphatase A
VSNRFAWALATWFGCGHCPIGPGTAGSAAAVVLALLLNRWHQWPGWAFVILAALLTAPAIWAARRMEEQTGRHDPGLVVVDEVLGQWIALAPSPALHWIDVLAAFLLFRFFDILKPFPVRRLESLPSGAGVVADDLMAGFYAALVLFAVRCFNFY